MFISDYYKCPGASVISYFDENSSDKYAELCLILITYEIYVVRIWNNSSGMAIVYQLIRGLLYHGKLSILSIHSHQKRLVNSVDFWGQQKYLTGTACRSSIRSLAYAGLLRQPDIFASQRGSKRFKA